MGTSSTTNLRVSDAERNEVADKLSRHFAEGRLDQSEFKERLDAAMSAKTQGDLAGLFDDLPRLTDEPAPRPSRRRRLVPFLVIVAIVALAAGSTISFLNVVHVPWLLIAVVGFFVWHRLGRRRHVHN
jgi:Flp pilus assembly protein TadB